MDMSTVCIEGITVATLQKKKKENTHRAQYGNSMLHSCVKK